MFITSYKKESLYCFYGAIPDSYQQNLVATGGELCSSYRELTVAFQLISEHIALQTMALLKGWG